MANPIDVATWFVNRIDRNSGESITHLKVQKLLYYAQAWHLLAFEKPLFTEELRAWSHGPVVPSVYHSLKEHGWNAIPELAQKDELDAEAEGILEQVLSIYGEFSAKRLEAMTHSEDPWKEARGDLQPEARCDAVISREAIKAYFKRTYGELEDEKEAA